MNKLLKSIYQFLFIKHDIGFFRFCMAMLIPAALSQEFCRFWMIILVFMQTLVLWARTKQWNITEAQS